jgi:hypothetical protein
MSRLPHFQAELLQLGHQLYLFAGIGKKPLDGKLCRIVHPTTLSHFAPGILHSPGCYWLLGVVVGDGVAAGAGNALKVSIRSFQVSPSRTEMTTNSP